MELFIQNYCSISAAGVWCNELNTEELIPLSGGQALSVEPNYTNLIPPMQLRRMSKPIRLGLAAAKLCLSENTSPHSIHVGTAYGNLTDSEKFLESIVLHDEQTLTPTAFIQSTHNTVSGQIALALSCNAHNMTFVHRAHSLERAFLDAQLQLHNAPESYALVGAVDECTPIAYDAIRQLKVAPDGVSIAEGSTFFQVSNTANSPYKAKIMDLLTFKTSEQEEAFRLISEFVRPRQETDALVLGIVDEGFRSVVAERFFQRNDCFTFKEYCGSFPTAVGFGLCLAIERVQQQAVAWLINQEGSYWSLWRITK